MTSNDGAYRQMTCEAQMTINDTQLMKALSVN